MVLDVIARYPTILGLHLPYDSQLLFDNWGCVGF